MGSPNLVAGLLSSLKATVRAQDSCEIHDTCGCEHGACNVHAASPVGGMSMSTHLLARDIAQTFGTHHDVFRTRGRFSLAFLATALSLSAGANTYIVDTNLDPGPDGSLSLRQAIVSANGAAGNTIAFDSSLDGSTMTLEQGLLKISNGVDINAAGQNITIDGNNASGIFFIAGPFDGTVYMEGLTLTNGRSNIAGGALRIGEAQVNLSNVTVTGNHVSVGGPAYNAGGGGIYIGSGVLNLSDSKVTGNDAQGASGGGIRVFQGSATITRSRIDHNTTNYYGGAIALYNGSLTLEQSTIDQNRSVHTGSSSFGGGGAISVFNVSSGYATTVTNSTIANNYALTAGPGVQLYYADVGAPNTIRFTTIAGNYSGTAGTTGNGIRSVGGMANIFATIVANNTDTNGIRNDLSGSFVANDSLILTPGTAILSGSGSILGADPQLGVLADNGGPTWTMIPAAASPAIDMVTQSFAETIDQRGYNRPVGASGDAGAVERQTVDDIIFRNGFEF